MNKFEKMDKILSELWETSTTEQRILIRVLQREVNVVVGKEAKEIKEAVELVLELAYQSGIVFGDDNAKGAMEIVENWLDNKSYCPKCNNLTLPSKIEYLGNGKYKCDKCKGK